MHNVDRQIRKRHIWVQFWPAPGHSTFNLAEIDVGDRLGVGVIEVVIPLRL
jgi:hypothetical protein